MLLCHDQYDRSYERFTQAYLDRFALTLPGKSVLSGHDAGGYSGSGALPLARFFTASVERRSEDIPIPTRGRRVHRMTTGYSEGERSAKGAEVVPGFTNERRDVNFLSAGFYFPNDEQAKALLNRIDLGVYRSVSIGFRYDDITCDLCNASYLRSDCPHIIGWELVDGRIVTGTYSGDVERAEALEGSIVYLGAQPQARLIKQISEGAVEPHALAATPHGEDLVLLKEAEQLARDYGHRQKSWAFPGLKAPASGKETQIMDREKLIEALGLAKDATDADIEAGIKANREAADQAKSTASQLAKVLGHTDPAKTPALEVLVKDAAALAPIGKTALEDLQKSILDDDLAATGKTENAELLMVVEHHVEQRSYDRLKTLADQKRDARLEIAPGKSGDPKAGAPGEKKTEAIDPLGDEAFAI